MAFLALSQSPDNPGSNTPFGSIGFVPVRWPTVIDKPAGVDDVGDAQQTASLK
jgi:hypothetical protein